MTKELLKAKVKETESMNEDELVSLGRKLSLSNVDSKIRKTLHKAIEKRREVLAKKANSFVVNGDLDDFGFGCA